VAPIKCKNQFAIVNGIAANVVKVSAKNDTSHVNIVNILLAIQIISMNGALMMKIKKSRGAVIIQVNKLTIEDTSQLIKWKGCARSHPRKSMGAATIEPNDMCVCLDLRYYDLFCLMWY